MSESQMAGIQVKCVRASVRVWMSSCLRIYRYVSGGEGFVGGRFGCEDVWECTFGHVWVYVCYQVSGYLGMDCAGSGTGVWVQRCGVGEAWCGVYGCKRMCGTVRAVCARPPGGF